MEVDVAKARSSVVDLAPETGSSESPEASPKPSLPTTMGGA